MHIKKNITPCKTRLNITVIRVNNRYPSHIAGMGSQRLNIPGSQVIHCVRVLNALEYRSPWCLLINPLILTPSTRFKICLKTGCPQTLFHYFMYVDVCFLVITNIQHGGEAFGRQPQLFQPQNLVEHCWITNMNAWHYTQTHKKRNTRCCFHRGYQMGMAPDVYSDNSNRTNMLIPFA